MKIWTSFIFILITLGFCFLYLPQVEASTILGTTNVDPFNPNMRSICRDGQGNLHAVWARTGNYIRYANSTDDGVTWNTRDIGYGSDFNFPSISCNGNNITIAYIDRGPPVKKLCVNISTDNGVTWSGTTPAVALGPSAQVERRGSRIYLVFENDSYDSMFMNSTDGGDTWGPITTLFDGNYLDYPICDGIFYRSSSMVVSGSGGAGDDIYVTVKYEYRDDDPNPESTCDLSVDSTYTVYFKNSTNAGTSWSPARTVKSSTSNQIRSVSIDYNSSNPQYIYISYGELVGSSHEMYFSNSTDGGTNWTEPYRIDQLGASAYDANYPSVTVDINGNPVVFWEQDQSYGNNFNIVYRKYNGTAWQTVQYVTTDDLDNDFVNTKWNYNNGRIEFIWRNGTSPYNIMYDFLAPYLEVSLSTPDPATCTESSPCSWTQNQTYWVNATVTCREDDCGLVNGNVRYNSTGETMIPINSTKGATPFYIISKDAHPYDNAQDGSHTEPDNPEYAYDDGLNDTSTFANFFAQSTSDYTSVLESEIYYWVFPADTNNGILFYTSKLLFDCGAAGADCDLFIYAWNWTNSVWDRLLNVDESDGGWAIIETKNLSLNSSYFDSNGNARIIFRIASGRWETGSPWTEFDLYDTYISANLTEYSSQPASCGNMNEGDICQLNWTVNATGAIDSAWKIDANFSSSVASENDTDDAIVRIGLPPVPEMMYSNGIALYYYTGERVNGNVTVIPVENPENKINPTAFTNGEWSVDFNMSTDDVLYLTYIIDDNEKIGYTQLKLDNDNPSTAGLDCTTQNISLSGYSVDVDSGEPSTSGNVRVSVLDTDYMNTTSFSGTWSIDFHPCLISGKIYTLQILISDNTGERGEIIQKYPAK